MTDLQVMFAWRSFGRIFDPSASGMPPWMREFAQCPTPFLFDPDTVRVIISTRPGRDADGQYVSRPGYVDLARSDLRKVVNVSPGPLLELGGLGAFDEFGIMPSSLVHHDGAIYLYYTGWTRLASVPYATAIGLATSRDGGRTFEKAGPGPLLGLTLQEPFLVNTPIVRVVDGVWHMWYVTGTDWVDGERGPESVLRVTSARSPDGLCWERSGAAIVPAILDRECQDMFCPVRIGDAWHAFFAYRSATGFRDDPRRGYRIGHACSRDLATWTRDDALAESLAAQASDWDSAMMCSTQFFALDKRLYLFYCGNEFGRGGFGIAELLANQ